MEAADGDDQRQAEAAVAESGDSRHEVRSDRGEICLGARDGVERPLERIERDPLGDARRPAGDEAASDEPLELRVAAGAGKDHYLIGAGGQLVHEPEAEKIVLTRLGFGE